MTLIEILVVLTLIGIVMGIVGGNYWDRERRRSKMLLDSNVALVPIDLTLCATAPLSPQIAARAEAAFAAPLVEIYGSTDMGATHNRCDKSFIQLMVFSPSLSNGYSGRLMISHGQNYPPESEERWRSKARAPIG